MLMGKLMTNRKLVASICERSPMFMSLNPPQVKSSRVWAIRKILWLQLKIMLCPDTQQSIHFQLTQVPE